MIPLIQAGLQIIRNPPPLIVNSAKGYIYFCDSILASVAGTISCVRAAGLAATNAFQTGLLQTALDTGKSLFGINQFKAGFHSLLLQEERCKACKTAVIPRKIEQKEMAERIGLMAGLVFNGACRMFATGIGMSCYCLGSLSNALAWNPRSTMGVHAASKKLASGVNGIALQFFPALAITLESTNSAVLAIAKCVLNHPNVPIISALGYFSAKQIVNAAEAESILEKISYIAAAILPLVFGGSLLFPKQASGV